MKHDDFVGPLAVPESELIRIARDTIGRLGYSEKMLEMEKKPLPMGGPGKGATNGITRYHYDWRSLPLMDGTSIVAVEVDSRNKTVKSLYIATQISGANRQRSPCRPQTLKRHGHVQAGVVPDWLDIHPRKLQFYGNSPLTQSRRLIILRYEPVA